MNETNYPGIYRTTPTRPELKKAATYAPDGWRPVIPPDSDDGQATSTAVFAADPWLAPMQGKRHHGGIPLGSASQCHGEAAGFLLWGARIWAQYREWHREAAVTCYVRYIFLIVLLDVKCAYTDYTITRQELRSYNVPQNLCEYILSFTYDREYIYKCKDGETISIVRRAGGPQGMGWTGYSYLCATGEIFDGLIGDTGLQNGEFSGESSSRRKANKYIDDFQRLMIVRIDPGESMYEKIGVETEQSVIDIVGPLRAKNMNLAPKKIDIVAPFSRRLEIQIPTFGIRCSFEKAVLKNQAQSLGMILPANDIAAKNIVATSKGKIKLATSLAKRLTWTRVLSAGQAYEVYMSIAGGAIRAWGLSILTVAAYETQYSQWQIDELESPESIFVKQNFSDTAHDALRAYMGFYEPVTHGTLDIFDIMGIRSIEHALITRGVVEALRLLLRQIPTGMVFMDPWKVCKNSVWELPDMQHLSPLTRIIGSQISTLHGWSDEKWVVPSVKYGMPRLPSTPIIYGPEEAHKRSGTPRILKTDGIPEIQCKRARVPKHTDEFLAELLDERGAIVAGSDGSTKKFDFSNPNDDDDGARVAGSYGIWNVPPGGSSGIGASSNMKKDVWVSQRWSAPYYMESCAFRNLARALDDPNLIDIMVREHKPLVVVIDA